MFLRINQKPNKIKIGAFSLLMAAALVLTACGGGGGSTAGGGDVQALTLPSRIELSNVDDTGAAGAGAARALGGALRGAYNDAGTDYSDEVKNSWVDDTDALDMVNEILGVCKDTSYENFVNQGAYKALVRQVGESKESQSGNSATSTTTEQLMEIYVNVTRASNSDPMIVKIWVEESDGPGGQAMLIRGHFTVEQGVSSTYPYGVMTAHFKGTALDGSGNEGDDLFTMAMSVGADGGNVVIENVEDNIEGGGFEFHRKVRVVANEDVTEGNAYVSVQETDWDTGLLPDPTVVQVAFNADYFKVTEASNPAIVFSKANLYHRVFNYKLFDAVTGAKITRNSGFPIETADGKHGYVGYYGIWAPHGATIAHGDTVADMDGNEYTIFRAAGKLTQHTQDSLLLSDLNGVELSMWSDGSDNIVTWDGSDFITLGYRDNSNGQIVYYESGDPEYHAVVTLTEWDGAWCEALRAFLRLGSLLYDDMGNPSTPSDSDTVYYHAEQTLDPGTASDLTLYSWEFALDMPITQTVIDNSNTAQNTYWSGSPSEKTFEFLASEMMLYDGSMTYPVTLGSGLDVSGTNYEWGYHIGPLTTTSYTESWEAYEAATYYTWNTGADEWNQYATLIDSSGDFVSFDAPISFSYTHATDNDVNGESDYDGKKFRMEYDGFSVNIPWEYDPVTGEWQPLINITDGTVMGPNGDDYVIKATEEALLMEEVSDPTGITFSETTVGEPTLTYDSTKTALVGALPVSALLKVIKGEVIE